MSLPEIPAGMPAKATVRRILDPETWRKRQIETLKSVGPTNYKIGIANPHKDPIEAGIAAQPVYVAKMKDDEVLARRVKGLQATNMDEWYALSANLGSARLSDGVAKREFKVARFLNAWVPVLEDHVRKLDAMPVTTDAEREEKVLANIRGLKALHGAWRGR